MESGLKMNFKTKGGVSVDCESGVGMYELHEHRQQDGEGAAPLSSALLTPCACSGASQALSNLLPPQINPALREDKCSEGGERTR